MRQAGGSEHVAFGTSRGGDTDVTVRVLLRPAATRDDAQAVPRDFRSLSESGWRQATHVARELRHLKIRALLSSPSLACRQTLLPLAATLSLEIEPYRGLSHDADRTRVLRLLLSPESAGVVVCTHDEVIDDVLEQFQHPSFADGHPVLAMDGCWLIERPVLPRPRLPFRTLLTPEISVA